MDTSSIAYHWYDLTCPFCYVSQSRNKILQASGYNVISLPFQAHPDIPAEGLYMAPRKGPMYDLLQKEASEAGLPLAWPERLPNSRYALALAEQVRRHHPELFPALKERLYAAHFALNEDLGSTALVNSCLAQSGISMQEINEWVESGQAFEDLRASQANAQRIGVTGTPAWMLDGRLIIGLPAISDLDYPPQPDEN
jgi:predicted DsbA family dithiol-disulfide isomerase